MTNIYDLLNQKFASRRPRNPYEFIEFFNNQVKLTKSGTVGNKDSPVFIEIYLKSDDGDFLRPGRTPMHTSKSMMATVYKPNSDDPDAEQIVNYRTRVLKNKVQDWVQKVDAEATNGLRIATYGYRLGEFIQTYQTCSGITTTLMTHDKYLSQIEDLLQKPIISSK